MELPNELALRFIVSTYGGLLARHGKAFRGVDLVQPTDDYFPDEIAMDLPSLGRLLERVASYAPISADVPLAVRVVEVDEGAASQSGGGCSSGGCGTGGAGAGPRDGVIELDEGGYLVEINVADVRHPVLLTTSLARSVGAIVLAEAEEEVSTSDLGATSEIAAVACGLGVIVHAGAYVYGKSCGGARVHQGTTLSVEELGVVLALFARANEMPLGTVRKHLDATQREALALAVDWLSTNDDVQQALRDHPAALEAGAFRVAPQRGGGILARLFG